MKFYLEMLNHYNDLTAKVTKFSGTDSSNTYVTIDQLAYDATNKKLGLKVNGADTVIPFSSGVTLTDWSFDVYIQGHSSDARYGTWGKSTFTIPNLGWKSVKITHISSLRGTPTTTPTLGILTDISNESSINFSFQSYSSANSDNYSTVRVELKI